MKKIRIDFAIPMLIAFGIGSLINFGGGKVLDTLETQSEDMVYSDSEIGAAASKNVPVVSSISEMMTHDYFTFHTDDTFNDTLYYDDTFYQIYELESGETVLVDEYFYHSYYDHDDSEDSYFSNSYQVLPIGRVVSEPLDEELIAKLAADNITLSDTSFYIDMRGDFKDFSREDYEFKLELLCFGIGLVVFFLMRYVMIASGLFPPLFPLRFLKNWRWYISYYGVTYYGKEVDQITAYYKQNNMPAAAEAFAKLTNTDICEAREAINMWYAISGEGLV